MSDHSHHQGDGHSHAGHGHGHAGDSLNRTAALATLHCLTGCAIGEVLGMVIGTALGWSDAATIALAIVLAFGFGYSLTMVPLLRSGLALAVALPLAFASDTFSIAVMEIVDNGVMLAVPGAMESPLSNPLFWGALAFALAVAYVAAFPVNRYLIARGRGHAVVHEYHGGHGTPTPAGGAGGPASPGRLILVGLAAIVLTIGVAAGGATLVDDHGGDEAEHVETREDAHGANPAHGASDQAAIDEEVGGLVVSNRGYSLSTAETLVPAATARPFRFRIVDADGEAVRDFDEHGGVRMHLIVVRRDLTGYQHLHPALQPSGDWLTTLRLPEAGAYRAFADFERDGTKVVLGTDLLAGGNFEPKPLPAARADGRVAGYAVELDAHASAGEETTLTYRISRNGRPVNVEPYLGAGGHLVALRAGDLAYLHVHPLTDKTGELTFAATFPTAGEYRLFLQFKDGGRVQTLPLTLSVGEADDHG